ncbi:hypothetical protein [Luteolibacter sp. LG18]|uniref:hypothetical protein n=1 Tax=Luteolibacter sp. LG18 TaxID=2819286 RepID=UPI002B2B3AA8|nr:hypothetical protein llg_13050 [Luteolibacter sp. LG18]
MAGHSASAHRFTAFRISCWTIGVIAFAEVMSAAVALAARLETNRPVRIVEKIVEVPKIVAVPVPAAVDPAVRPGIPAISAISATLPTDSDNSGVVAKPPANPLPVAPVGPAPTPVATPPIADPVVERLVTEARKARVAEDMGAAIIKLEEAARKSPDEPNVEYELGLVHEAMGVYDKASEHYENVFRMGASKAGTLYEMAAGKLRDGIQEPDVRGKLVLGRTRIFKDAEYQDGERVVLTIPVQAAPGTSVAAEDFFVKVLFYDSLKGKEVVPARDTSVVKTEWASLPIDWAGGEELLRVTYIIPRQDEQDEHLFGHRAYYGQSVELNYKNELIDVQAWPRDLAARNQQVQQPQQPQQQPNGLPGPGDVPPEFLNKEELPRDFNPGAPLLPLPSH